MQNLINFIQNEKGEKCVSAKSLHSFLEVKTRLDKWIPRMMEYGFIENVDFQRLSNFDHTLNRDVLIDFFLSLDCAKEISMIQRTEKGKQARMYFIECEKQLKQIIQPQIRVPQTLAEALRLAADMSEQKERLEIENARLHERTDFIDIVFTANDLLSCSEVCKILNLSYGNKTLFKKLRESGIFFKNRN